MTVENFSSNRDFVTCTEFNTRTNNNRIGIQQLTVFMGQVYMTDVQGFSLFSNWENLGIDQIKVDKVLITTEDQVI